MPLNVLKIFKKYSYNYDYIIKCWKFSSTARNRAALTDVFHGSLVFSSGKYVSTMNATIQPSLNYNYRRIKRDEM